MTVRLGGATVALLAVLGAAAPCRATGPVASDGVFLHFLAGGRSVFPHLSVSLGGPRFPAVLDTGSTGLLVSPDRLAASDASLVLGPARLAYSSSGRIMIGTWLRERVTITGQDGVGVTTRPMPVMLVRQVRCLPAARRCTPSDRPHGIAMLGVGFAREADHQPQGTPDRNALLQVPGTLRRGYVLSEAGVQVGLTPDTAQADGFQTIRLTRNAAGTDWAAPPVCITIDGGVPACGTVLMDTGVTRMFLRVPPGSRPAGDVLPDGSRIHLQLGGRAAGPSPALSYDLVVGDRDSPLSPTHVTLVGIGDRPPFVNTGVRFLRCFAVLFDADEGVIGYRRRAGC